MSVGQWQNNRKTTEDTSPKPGSCRNETVNNVIKQQDGQPNGRKGGAGQVNGQPNIYQYIPRYISFPDYFYLILVPTNTRPTTMTQDKQPTRDPTLGRTVVPSCYTGEQGSIRALAAGEKQMLLERWEQTF